PRLAIVSSGKAEANINSGHVKFGPLILRSFHAHSASAPVRQAIGPHQLYRPGRKFSFQHFIINCHCSEVSWRVSATPFSFSIRVSWSGVKIEGTRKANSPRRSNS